MFSTLIQKYEQLRKGIDLTDAELAQLIVEAKLANTAHPAEWAAFLGILKHNTDLDKDEVRDTYRRCRITADLGAYPYGVTEFISAFLTSRGYTMSFSGEFTNARDTDYILKQMQMWSHEIIPGAKIYPDPLIQAAFQNWRADEKTRLLARGYGRVAYDRDADAQEIVRFVTYITKPTGDPIQDASLIRAGVVAMTNFIYRVKNHMRGRWYHSVHMMPVLVGPQGSGKTTAVRHLLSPLADFSSAVGFDILEHDAKMYQLSVTPIMFFDELAGITKAENERLKDIMHTRQRELRQIYKETSSRTLISTFIGCSNKEISAVIRDETGNRRYFQIDTPAVLDRDVLMKFDALAMWRAVDEDGEPPLYANAGDLAAVQSAQQDQRHYGPVEHWISTIPRTLERRKPSDLFANDFSLWMQDNYPGALRYHSSQSFGRELSRLSKMEGSPVTVVRGKNGGSLYTVEAK